MNLKRSLILIFSFTLMATAVLAAVGQNTSGRFTLLLNPPPEGPVVVPVPSGRFSLITDRIGYDQFGPFALNTGSQVISTTFYHLGDDPTSPCDPGGTVLSLGNTVSLGFVVSSDELSGYLDTGVNIRFSVYNVSAAATGSLSFNGSQLGWLPINTTCNAVVYEYPITDLLHSGSNSLSLYLAGTTNLPDLVVGNFELVAGSGGGIIQASITSALDSVTFNITRNGLPFDGVRVSILAASQEIRSAVPVGGTVIFSGLSDGSYFHRVQELQQNAPILIQEPFIIDSTNQPPVIISATANPVDVQNSGTETATLRVTAQDSDGSVSAVSADLRQLGIQTAEALVDVGGGVWETTVTIQASVSPAIFKLPINVIDDRGAGAVGQIILTVSPVGGWDALSIVACGFTIQVTQVVETTPGVWTATGNVRMSHSSGLPLLLDATGTVIVNTGAVQSISANGSATLKADLGDLGVLELLRGDFSILESGELVPGGNVSMLLSDLSGFALDPATMSVSLLLGAQPGLRILTEVLFDSVDGIVGNNAPLLNAEITALADGTLSGQLQAGSGAMAWNIFGGILAFSDLSWVGQQITINGASFTIGGNIFGPAQPDVVVLVPNLEIGPQGIHADTVLITGFSFDYGGFQFNVGDATFTSDAFLLEQACIVFPLPTGDLSTCVYNMEITAAGLDIGGGEIKVPPLKVGTYNLAGVYANFKQSGGNYYLQAQGTLSIPSFAHVKIEFALDSACTYLLNEFCMAAEFAGSGITLGSSGLLLTDIGGCYSTNPAAATG